MRERGLRVVLHLERFADDARDEEWIAEAAAEGWVALTADVEIRRRPNEKRAIYLAKLRVFALTRNTWTWREKANAFLTALPGMAQMLSKTQGPFIAKINKAGEVTSVYDFTDYRP